MLQINIPFRGVHLCLNQNILKHVLFYSHCTRVPATMLIFDHELTKPTDINLKKGFVFHPLFCFRLVMHIHLMALHR